MISKTRIGKKAERKTNPELRNLIIKLKKQGHLEVANILGLPRKKAVSVNLDKIDRESKEGDTVLVPGKVLGKGEVLHKLTIAAFSFSHEAREKLKNSKIMSIEEILDKGFKIVK